MGERRRGLRRMRPDRLVVAGVLALVLVLTGGVAWAFWGGSGTAAGPGPLTSWRVPAPVATCTDTDGPLFETAVVSWPEVTDPHVLDYTATINGVAAPVQDDGNTRSVVIDQAMLLAVLGSLITGPLTIEVTATLPGTAWTSPVTTETIQAGVSVLPPGLTLECGASPACFATFVVEFVFEGGFQAGVTVTAGDTAISQWSTMFSIGSATMTERWNADFSISGDMVTASNLDWNGSIAPGASRTFGFTANGPAPTGEVPVSCTGQ